MIIDRSDFGLLLGMYDDAPTMYELGHNNKKRVYRLSRAGLCMCDKPSIHPGQPRCWSLTPTGTSLVETVDEEYGNLWRLRGWEIRYSAPCRTRINTFKS
jgi:hypothetical protein